MYGSFKGSSKKSKKSSKKVLTPEDLLQTELNRFIALGNSTNWQNTAAITPNFSSEGEIISEIQSIQMVDDAIIEE